MLLFTDDVTFYDLPGSHRKVDALAAILEERLWRVHGPRLSLRWTHVIHISSSHSALVTRLLHTVL